MAASQISRRAVALPGTVAQTRLDQALPQLFATSRRQARAAISAGVVRVNGRTTKQQSRLVQAYDVLSCDSPVLPLPTPPAPRILRENKWYSAVHKQAGQLAQVDASRWFAEHPQASAGPSATDWPLDVQVGFHMAAAAGKPCPHLHLQHRLDRPVSGAVLFSKKPALTKKLAEIWGGPAVRRSYIAVVRGTPSWSMKLVRAPIARDRAAQWRFQVSATGKPAATLLYTMARGPNFSVIGAMPVTGRTHQVRVHCAAAGHPIVNDELYSSADGSAPIASSAVAAAADHVLQAWRAAGQGEDLGSDSGSEGEAWAPPLQQQDGLSAQWDRLLLHSRSIMVPKSALAFTKINVLAPMPLEIAAMAGACEPVPIVGQALEAALHAACEGATDAAIQAIAAGQGSVAAAAAAAAAPAVSPVPEQDEAARLSSQPKAFSFEDEEDEEGGEGAGPALTPLSQVRVQKNHAVDTYLASHTSAGGPAVSHAWQQGDLQDMADVELPAHVLAEEQLAAKLQQAVWQAVHSGSSRW